MDGAESCPVTSGHILIQRLNGICSRHLTEFLVHVVCSGAGIVTDPDTKVLDLQWALLVDLKFEQEGLECLLYPSPGNVETYHIEADNLAVRLLDLAQLHQEEPEPRLSNYLIGRENAHAVELWGRVSLGGQMTPDDLVLVETP